ncbi:MAG: TonB-dependent receptor [Sulfuricurvum sp.]
MKPISISLVVVSLTLSLMAESSTLKSVSVEASVVDEVSSRSKNSVDLAKTLKDHVPSIDISRRSSVANDIYIRGQKRDNISIDMDGAKVCGACVNRMDPPISHIVTSQISNVEVIEGPYDVENFGTLSGGVRIKTKEPTRDLSGEIDVGAGSWGYKKVGVSVSGSSGRVGAVLGYVYEEAGEYKDGDGRTMSKQTQKAVDDGKAAATSAYAKKPDRAYAKKSALGKIFVKTLEDQELRLSYTANRTDRTLYPNSAMDAAYDDSNIYSIEYNIDNISNIYKNLSIQYYYSDVDHPMDTKLRVAGSGATYMTNHLKTTMQGVKLKNSFDIADHKVLFGLDGSRRSWEGERYSTNTMMGMVMPMGSSLDESVTNNRALFAKVERSVGALDVSVGARADFTHVKTKDATKNSRDFNSISLNALASYDLGGGHSLFAGAGSATRVPDARELYATANYIDGNDKLKQTKNLELDLGYEFVGEDLSLKAKAFNSNLKDYIYLVKDGARYGFENIDARVYGFELSGIYYANDDVWIDAMASYKRGTKRSYASDESKHIADMAPLRARATLNYEYMPQSVASFEVEASDRWGSIDANSGEQKLAGWSVYNAKIKHAVSKNLDLTLGVDNITNKTYARSNSYVDIILLSSSGATMLLNEAGRYFYTNVTLKF